MSALVAHYQRVQGLGDWSFSVDVVPGLKHQGADAWAVVLPDASTKTAQVSVRDIDATPIPNFDGDPMLEIRVTISHELFHCLVAEAIAAGMSVAAEEKLVEAAAQAVVRSETTGDARVMARSVSALPSAVRARIAASAGRRARGGHMDPEMVKKLLDAIEANDLEAIKECGKQLLAEAASGGGAAAPPSDPAGGEAGKVAPPAPEGGETPPAGKPEAPIGARAAARAADPEILRARKTAQDAADDMARMHAQALPAAKSALITGARARLGADAISPATEKRIMAAPTFARAEEILAIVEETPTAVRARSGAEIQGANPEDPKTVPAAELAKEGFEQSWIGVYEAAAKRDPREGAAFLDSGRTVMRARKARLASQNGGGVS